MKNSTLSIVSLFLIVLSCSTNPSVINVKKPIFTSTNFAVESFIKNTQGYILTLSYISDNVKEGTILHVSNGKIGESQVYKKNQRMYQFIFTIIPSNEPFNMEFGLGIRKGAQLVIYEKVIFENITINDISNQFVNTTPKYISLNSTDENISTTNQNTDVETIKKEHQIQMVVSNNFELDEDPMMWGFDLNNISGLFYGHSEIFYAKKDIIKNAYPKYFNNKVILKYELNVNVEKDEWALSFDFNNDGLFSENEKISGNKIEKKYPKRYIFLKGNQPVAYLGKWDSGYGIRAFLGDYQYIINNPSIK